MYYQITMPPTATTDKQADELGRLLKYGKQMTVQFVTVAGRYKPARVRLTLLTVPDRVADQAMRVMQLLAGREDAVKSSAAVRQRAEWTLHAMLIPTDPVADPPDGTILDGWDSACLTITYQPGRAVARLACCPEDADRLAEISLPGWRLTIRPKVIARASGGRAWHGVPSFVPVPGGVVQSAPASAPQPQPQIPDTPPAPLPEEAALVLTKADDGVLLGVAPDGEAVRLARRAMTLALLAPAETRQTAVLSLMRRGMQAGLGMIVAVERALLPSEALAAWEARVRLLDVQHVASSCAIPWQQIAPDLLAQALVGPAAGERIGSPLPDRFAAVLEALGAGALRVPAVLGLVARPGDDLRRALAAGGMVVVPQDGDAASTVIARLLMAYLATPPSIGRAVLMIAGPALVPPDGLRDQAIQVVLGERGDALLRMAATDSGWCLTGPDGTCIADMLPDLLAQPASGTSELVETIIGAIGQPEPIAAPAEEEAGWWAASERDDDLDEGDEPDLADRQEAPAVGAGEIIEAAPAIVLSAADLPVEEPIMPMEILSIGDAPDAEIPAALEVPAVVPLAADADADTVRSDLDAALEGLLNALMASVYPDMTDREIRSAVANEAFADADALALAWAERASTDPRPWCWRVVLAEDDADRAAAAEYGLRLAPDGPHTALLRAVLDALAVADLPPWTTGTLDAGDVPFDGLAQLDAEDEQLDALPFDDATSANLAGWPVQLDDEVVGGEHETPLAPDVNGWGALDGSIADDAHSDAEYAPFDSLGQPGTPFLEADELTAEVLPIAADPLAPAEADHGRQDAEHAPFDLLVAVPLPAADPIAPAEADHGRQDAEHVPFDLLVKPATETADLLVAMPPLVAGPIAPAPAAHARQGAEHAIVEAPAVPVTASPALANMPAAAPRAADELDDAAIRAAWLGGESIPALIALLTDAGVAAPMARARVRQAISSRPAAPASPVTATLPGAASAAEPPAGVHPAAPVVAMNGIGAPFMPAAESEDEAIWRRWLENKKTEDMVQALCGRRGGPKADAARDRIYAVVVPRIVAELEADDLVDQLCAGGDVTSNPRYETLMKRLARSETPPAGSLEQSLRRRLIAARQEV